MTKYIGLCVVQVLEDRLADLTAEMEKLRLTIEQLKNREQVRVCNMRVSPGSLLVYLCSY